MQAALTFEASTRETTGKGAARALRRDGKVPASIYGHGKDSQKLVVDAAAVTREYLRGGFFNKIVELKTGKTSLYALPKAVQMHPVSDRLEHVDFYQVDEKSTIRVKVPVHFLNQEKCIGIKRGGVLNVVRHSLELLCKVGNIPTHIDIDLAEANIGDSIHISHVKLPDGVKPSIARDFTIASIAGRGGKDDADEAATGVAAGAVPATNEKAKADAAAKPGAKAAPKPAAKK